VIGILLFLGSFFFGQTGSNFYENFAVITFFTIIGGIVIFFPIEDKENRRRIIKGRLILFIGSLIFLFDTLLGDVYTKDALFLFIDSIVIGIAFILTGIFTIRPIN